MFSDASLEERVASDHPVCAIRRITDRVRLDPARIGVGLTIRFSGGAQRRPLPPVAGPNR